MRRERTAYSGPRRHTAQIGAGGGGRPGSPAGRAVDDAEQGADRECEAQVNPRLQLRPGPFVHADFAATTALDPANEQGAATVVEVGLVERECLVDSQARAPEHGDQAAQPASGASVAGRAHHGDDLLDGWRIRRVAVSLVA